MRTTLTIDDDLVARLEALSRRRGLTFKQVVNDALRRGLKPAGARSLRLPAFDCGGALPGIDLDKATKIDASLENESIRQALLMGR